MAHQHPEILADRLPSGMFGGPSVPSTYGMRQNMDTDSPAYRFYAERLIRHIVAHYKDNPTVIGWQLDNETIKLRRRQSATSSSASSIILKRNSSPPKR